MKKINLKWLGVIVYVLLIHNINAQQSLVVISKEIAQNFTTKDNLFKHPFIDIDEWRDKPIRHRYIHGGFDGTETRFSLYFPSKEKYKGRFFQYITPFPDNENLSQNKTGEEDVLGFSLGAGSYFIETNGGGKVDFAKPNFNADPTIGAYRANAATAEFSRIVALKILGGNRPFGYAFGGSGGAYRTVGSIENTDGVWDGVVPFVMGSPMAIPNVFAVRMNAMRILNDKFPQIIDAMDAGGSGNIYEGLNEEEKEALIEATQLGFPPQSWFGYKTMGIHGLIALYQGIRSIDSKYFEDFWKVKGYLGANPTESLLKARLQKTSKIKAIISIDNAVKLGLKEPMSASERGTADLAWKSMGISDEMPAAFQIEDILPDVNFMGGDLVVKTGAAAGKSIQLASVLGDKIVFGPVDASVLAQIKVGDEVFVDNSNFLALQTYFRHQVPGKEYKVWDYWRDSDGKPKFPQRPMLLGPLFTQAAAGVLPTGKFRGKMILVCSLWDREAFPWQGDFYREKVKTYLKDKTDENFRLWYTDHALHGELSKNEDKTRTVSYSGVLAQSLLDISDWVEKGKIPSPSTNYEIVDGQVKLLDTADKRKGLQPVVHLSVNENKKVVVKKGDIIDFSATVTIPHNTGKTVSAEWDFDGSGNFAVKQKKFSYDEATGLTKLKMKYKFNKEPGTYFVTLKVSSEREGNAKALFTKIQNLDRVRIIVE